MEPRYEWFVDWGDDNFRHAASAIPEHHVVSHLVDWGSELDDDSPDAGVLIANTGQLTLFEPTGLYLGFTSTLSEAMLTLPHRWRLDVEGITQRQGRAFPVLGTILGPDVQPVRWDLLGPNTDQLGTVEKLTIKAGTAVAAAKAISDATGISVTTTSPLNLAEIEWNGYLARLLNELADVLGGWVVEASDGSFTIVTAEVAAAQDAAVTIGPEYGIGLGSSGMGIQPGLIRTRITLTDSQDRENLLVFGDEERWGRRNFNLQPWYAPEPFSIIPALLARSEPKTFVQLGLHDHQATPERRLALAENAVPGKVVEASVPTPSGTRSAKVLVLRTTLAGTFDTEPERLVRGLVVGDIVIDGTTVLSDPWVTVAEARTSATAHVPSTANNGDRYWRLRQQATTERLHGETAIAASSEPITEVGVNVPAAGQVIVTLVPNVLALELRLNQRTRVWLASPTSLADVPLSGTITLTSNFGSPTTDVESDDWTAGTLQGWNAYYAEIGEPVTQVGLLITSLTSQAAWDLSITRGGGAAPVSSGSYKAATPVQDIPLANLTVDTDYTFEASLASTFDVVKAVDFNTRGIPGPYTPPAPPVEFPVCTPVTRFERTTDGGEIVANDAVLFVGTGAPNLYFGRWSIEFQTSGSTTLANAIESIHYGFPRESSNPATRPLSELGIPEGATALRIELGFEPAATTRLFVATIDVDQFDALLEDDRTQANRPGVGPQRYYGLRRKSNQSPSFRIPFVLERGAGLLRYPVGAIGSTVRTIRVCWQG